MHYEDGGLVALMTESGLLSRQIHFFLKFQHRLNFPQHFSAGEQPRTLNNQVMSTISHPVLFFLSLKDDAAG